MSQIDGNSKTASSLVRLLPFAVEASWITSRWDKLEEYIRMSESSESGDFNMRIGSALLSLQHGEPRAIAEAIRDLRLELGKGLTFSSTSSLQSCHDTLLKLHVLDDVETILGVLPPDRRELYTGLNRRLQVLGGYVSDKQYVLGLRRAAMQLW
jgi:serine/threonine-protein kinase ATR